MTIIEGTFTVKKVEASAPADHVVLYRQGGELVCTWRKLLDLYTPAAAQSMVAQLETQGYRAISRPLSEHQVVGFPIGWTAESVDPNVDKIIVTQDHSFWAMSPERYRSAA